VRVSGEEIPTAEMPSTHRSGVEQIQSSVLNQILKSVNQTAGDLQHCLGIVPLRHFCNKRHLVKGRVVKVKSTMLHKKAYGVLISPLPGFEPVAVQCNPEQVVNTHASCLTCLGDRAFGVAGSRLRSVERFADQPPSASPLPWTVPTGAKNAFIYLTVSAGPSEFLFLGADYK